VQLRLSAARYRQPPVQYLLGGLIRCGECGRTYCSARWYEKVARQSGDVTVSHPAAYRSNMTFSLAAHDLTRMKHCRNSRVFTHILDGKVVDMIRVVMFDSGKLRGCIETGEPGDDRKIAGGACANCRED
jgi:hypothetical protein